MIGLTSIFSLVSLKMISYVLEMNTSHARCIEAMSKVDLFCSGFCLTYNMMVRIKYPLMKLTIAYSGIRIMADSESIFLAVLQIENLNLALFLIEVTIKLDYIGELCYLHGDSFFSCPCIKAIYIRILKTHICKKANNKGNYNYKT